MASESQATGYGNFAVDFALSRLVDLCEPGEGIQTGPFGTQLHQEDYVSNGTPIITVEHLGENRILHSDLPCVSDDDRSRLSKYSLRTGDIVFSRVGSVDRRALVREEENGWLFSGRCLRVRPDQTRIDSGYLSYFFGLPSFKEHIRAIAVGATMPSLNTELLSNVAIRYPPLPEQRAIARILNRLDDKIELNRRMNKTLEEMAQVLFDHLFPYSTDDNLPDGWRVGRLDEVVLLQRGFDLPTPERLPGPYPIVAASGPSGTHNQFMVRGPGVTTGRSGVLGNVYFVHEDFWPLNTSLWVKEFRHATPAYAYHLLLDLDFELFNAGSAVPTLNRNHVHNLPVVIPPMQRVQEFDRAAMMLLKRQKSNHEESQILAALRDAQLRKLMSGEVRVKL